MTDVPDPKVLGWTFDQWAWAAARLNVDHIAGKSEALKMKRNWINKYHYYPGEVELEGVEKEANYDVAYDVFSIPWTELAPCS